MAALSAARKRAGRRYKWVMTDPVFARMFAEPDPFALLGKWMEEAVAAELNDPEAMTLATVDADGLPDARIVLCKGWGSDGLDLYTNDESAKGRELASTPRAALTWHWKSLRRQVRARGSVERLPADAADAYFATRARTSRLGAIASDQSRPLDRRETLEGRVAALEREFDGRDPPRPPHWGGYRVIPLAIEFWRDGAFRLHDRRRFTRDAAGAPWSSERLYP